MIPMNDEARQQNGVTENAPADSHRFIDAIPHNLCRYGFASAVRSLDSNA